MGPGGPVALPCPVGTCSASLPTTWLLGPEHTACRTAARPFPASVSSLQNTPHCRWRPLPTDRLEPFLPEPALQWGVGLGSGGLPFNLT